MNYKLLASSACSALLFTSILQAEWSLVFNGEDATPTNDESVLQSQGWIFQDWDYVGHVSCEETVDCTGVREIVTAPYGKGGNAVLIRASDPNVTDPSNARSISAFPLGAGNEIPSGGTATIYLRFAFDGYQISQHFGFTTNTAPVSGSTAPQHNYQDLGPTTQVSLHQDTTQETLAVYETYENSWWSSVTLDPDKDLETGVWYELWYQITNATVAEGGGYFELYIRGGDWGNGDPVHLANPYTTESGFTDYGFRAKEDAPIARFLNVANGGSPGSAMGIANDAIFFDDMYISLNEHILTTPDGGQEVESWGGYPIITNEDGGKFVNTGDWMNYLSVKHAPHIYSYTLMSWLYMNEPAADAQGSWAYIRK